MAIVTGDVVFNQGRPAVISKKDPSTGYVSINTDLTKTAAAAAFGIKNGLTEEGREAYQTVLSEVKNPDRKQEIDDLYGRILALREDKADPRMIRYLQSDLQHKIIREGYQPKDYALDIFTITG